MKKHTPLAYTFLKIGHVAIRSNERVIVEVADKSRINNMVVRTMDLCPIDRLVSADEFVAITGATLTIGDKTFKPLKKKKQEAPKAEVLDLISK